MMDKDQYIVIAGKVADGIASDSELALYNAQYNNYQVKYPAWNKLGEAEKKLMLDETALLVEAQLRSETVTHKVKLWPRVAAVVAAVTAITLGVWLYYISSGAPSSTGPEFVSGSQDIAPGKNRAMLTFDDGHVVMLSSKKKGVAITDSEVTYDDGAALSGIRSFLEEKRRMLTASTPRGGTYHVTLADGTMVWLNAASRLRFPSTFTGQAERRVELAGEAYFEVAKSKTQPFIVHSENQDVKVLGTKFNIENYSDESLIRTTLVEGSVQVNRISLGLAEQSQVLKPGEQALLSSKAINVENADVMAVTAWTKGDFIFSNEELPGIMKALSRWYDVEVEYQNGPQNLRFDAIISRSKKLSEILQTMQITGKVKFKIDGRKVIVTK